MSATIGAVVSVSAKRLSTSRRTIDEERNGSVAQGLAVVKLGRFGWNIQRCSA